MLFAKLDDSPMLRTQVSLLRLRDLGCSTGGSLGGALGWNVVARGGSTRIPWGRVTGLPLKRGAVSLQCFAMAYRFGLAAYALLRKRTKNFCADYIVANGWGNGFALDFCFFFIGKDFCA